MDKKDFQAEFPGANPQGKNRLKGLYLQIVREGLKIWKFLMAFNANITMVVDSHRPSGEDAGSGRG